MFKNLYTLENCFYFCLLTLQLFVTYLLKRPLFLLKFYYLKIFQLLLLLLFSSQIVRLITQGDSLCYYPSYNTFVVNSLKRSYLPILKGVFFSQVTHRCYTESK